jgi:hypothetical protein
MQPAFLRWLVVVRSSLSSGFLTTDIQANQASKTKEDFMSLAYKTEFPAIPPMDEAMPDHLETASFGLG